MASIAVHLVRRQAPSLETSLLPSSPFNATPSSTQITEVCTVLYCIVLTESAQIESRHCICNLPPPPRDSRLERTPTEHRYDAPSVRPSLGLSNSVHMRQQHESYCTLGSTRHQISDLRCRKNPRITNLKSRTVVRLMACALSGEGPAGT